MSRTEVDLVTQPGGSLARLAPPARQAIAVRLFSTGFGFSLALFAGFCVLVGVMMLRSRPSRGSSAR